MHEIATKLKAELKRAEADRAERIRKVDIQVEAQNESAEPWLSPPSPDVTKADMWELFLKRLENEKLKEENEIIKGQIENLKVLQND